MAACRQHAGARREPTAAAGRECASSRDGPAAIKREQLTPGGARAAAPPGGHSTRQRGGGSGGGDSGDGDGGGGSGGSGGSGDGCSVHAVDGDRGDGAQHYLAFLRPSSGDSAATLRAKQRGLEAALKVGGGDPLEVEKKGRWGGNTREARKAGSLSALRQHKKAVNKAAWEGSVEVVGEAAWEGSVEVLGEAAES
eukprot:365182-Chlamydomonas_euryale.AAC.6